MKKTQKERNFQFKVVYCCITLVMLLMVGCASVTHQYELSVEDIEKNPIVGAKIDYSLYDTTSGKTVKETSFITNKNGILRDSLNATMKAGYYYTSDYLTYFTYKVSKDGYYLNNGKISSEYGQRYSSDEKIKKETITLIKPIDYFNKEFASTLTDNHLKSKTMEFIDLIILKGLLSESILETNSVNLISFKNNDYLQFKFINSNVYNSIQLDKYEIGKRLFDEVIRKILDPLNDYIADSNLFYGYDLTIVGHTKNFLETYASDQPIEYRFLIPESIARKYKNKDLTGQQLLNNSIILMDNERIELKLQ